MFARRARAQSKRASIDPGACEYRVALVPSIDIIGFVAPPLNRPPEDECRREKPCSVRKCKEREPKPPRPPCTPDSLKCLALQCAEAAEVLVRANGPPTPAMYLALHALELAFKAYLMSRGAAEPEAVSHGHDLVSLLSAASMRGFKAIGQYATAKEMIGYVGPFYCGKHFEYPHGWDGALMPLYYGELAELVCDCVQDKSAIAGT